MSGFGVVYIKWLCGERHELSNIGEVGKRIEVGVMGFLVVC